MIERTKPFDIPKSLVFSAYKKVKENRGGAGIDDLTIEKFDQDLSKNLYKLWNRLSSGSYFPPAVKACDIIKTEGGTRTLGIPTVADRIAQEVVRSVLEPELEKVFDEDSYGYRPNKSALDAIGKTRRRCFDQDWLIEFDIKGMFDNIDHNLLMKAVRKHTTNKWVLLYIQRWLSAEIQQKDGTKIKRLSGVPQGGVVSPILSNLFMHYSFDMWMRREYPSVKCARYADDGVIHCVSKSQAQLILGQLEQRLKICKLEIKHT
ncbi:group II intron reverse transcriptase/maturase, partial [Wolbachia endosymbiont of Nilaparvata lugens]